MKYVKEITKEFIDDFAHNKHNKNERLLSVSIYDSGFYINIWSSPGPFFMPDQYWYDTLFDPPLNEKPSAKTIRKGTKYMRSICKCLGIPEGNIFDIKSKVDFLRENNYSKKLFSFKGYKNIEELRSDGIKTLRKIRKQVRDFEKKQFRLSILEAEQREKIKKGKK